MAEEPEEEGSEAAVDASALAELTLCENLAQVSGWAARWSANGAGADGALLWAPDAIHPVFLCIAAVGTGTEKVLRRSAPKSSDLVQQLLADREPVLLDRRHLLTTADPFLKGIPGGVEACVVVPLEAEGLVIGILNLLFQEEPDAAAAIEATSGFLQFASPALARALRSERKTVGMLHAIERLTNLYDLSKAFGSTIDLTELTQIIVRKTVDLLNAEAASLWTLRGAEGEVALEATGVNENYDVVPAPEAVGAAVVGDVIVEQKTILRNAIPEDDPLRTADEPYLVKSILAAPFVENDKPLGALVVANKRGRNPEFTAADDELLADIVRQAVRALHNARQYEAEKKVEELDALLTVSREITATLDLDKVMSTVVNASSALVAYDRCALAIMQRGKLRVGAISGMKEIDRGDASVKRTEELLEWVYHGGADVGVTEEDGRVVTDRPETEEKFRKFFDDSGMKSFYGVLLRDEEGKLGVLGFESAEPLVFEQDTRDMLQILVNQATVAIRNAQLYQQVPLAGFWKPLLQKRQKLAELPRKRTAGWALGIAFALVLLFVVPWPLRIAGPARVVPSRRTTVTASVEGFVESVLKREGDAVQAGEVIATQRDDVYTAALAEARSALSIAESEVARHRAAGDASASYQAQSRVEELTAQASLAAERVSWTRLKSPVAGVIVTPRLPERVGQFLPSGGELCAVADLREATLEVAVPEDEASRLATGQPVTAKINSYPTRSFAGQVTRVGATIHEEAGERFVLAECRMDVPEGVLRAGMVGKAKVNMGRRSLAYVLFRKPLRYIWLRLWPIVG